MLPPLTHRLSIESPGENEPFTLTGRDCTVRGSEHAGIAQVSVGGHRVVDTCRVTNASCSRFRITPLGIERELRVGVARVVEKTVVCATDTAFAIEWVSDADIQLTLALHGVASSMVVEPATMSDSPAVHLPAGEPRQLVIRGAAFDAGVPELWVRMQQAAAARRDAELVRVDFPETALNDAVGWAEFRSSNDANVDTTLTKDTWAEFTAGHSSAAIRRWRDLAMLCFSDEKGAWPQQPGCSAADLIAGLLYGMLGVEPDAERERLRLRPQLPPEFNYTRVQNLRVGDAMVELDFTRRDDRLRFELMQVAGAYPLRLIFEPTLTEVPRRILVDGRHAELNLAPFGERIVAPVQIMLDDRRTVEFCS